MYSTQYTDCQFEARYTVLFLALPFIRTTNLNLFYNVLQYVYMWPFVRCCEAVVAANDAAAGCPIL